MIRRAFLAAAALLVPLKGVVAACTEVKNGPSDWTGQSFACRIEGHYTPKNFVVSAGVRSWQWISHRNEKRTSELLGMRTAFLSWFLQTYQELGGTRDEAIEQVEYVTKAWRENKKCVATEHGQEMR